MKKLVLIVLAVACLVVPASAFAQDPYGDVAGSAQGGGGGTETATVSGDSGSLPFTGLELSLLLGGGAVLIGTGLLLRRVRHE